MNPRNPTPPPGNYRKRRHRSHHDNSRASAIRPRHPSGTLSVAFAQDQKRSRIRRAASRLCKLFEDHFCERRLKPLFTREVLSTRIKDSWNLFHLAASGWDLCLIPPRFLSQRNLRTWSGPRGNVFHIAAETGRLFDVPHALLTVENLTRRNGYGSTVLHLAARSQCFEVIPRKVLTPANLMLLDDAGNTVLHEAARGKALIEIPWQAQTEDAFATKNSDGHNALHIAACSETLRYIKQPQLVMTAKNLLASDRWGETPLELAILFGGLSDIPPSPQLAAHCKEIGDAIGKALHKHHPDRKSPHQLEARKWLAELTKLALKGK